MGWVALPGCDYRPVLSPSGRMEHRRSHGHRVFIEALESAAGSRPTQGVIHHSDRGSQYTSGAYQPLMSRLGMAVSMSRKGNRWDNAPTESFFATLKTERIHRRPWSTRQSVIDAVNEHIALFYNSSRRHWFTGGLSPVDYERAFDNWAALAA
jgi:putative transposase